MSRRDWAFESVTLRSPADGSGEVTEGIELYLDDVGITQRGGNPPQALQLPWSELHGLRCLGPRRGRGPELLAVLGPVAMSWELPEDALSAAEVVELDEQLRRGFAAAIADDGVAEERHRLVPERFAKVPAFLMVGLLLIATASVAIGITGGGNAPSTTTSPGPAPALLRANDLGPGWHASTSSSSFVGALIAPDSGKSTKAQQAQSDQVAREYEWCMAKDQAHDRLFNPANPKPRQEERSSVLVRGSVHGQLEAGNVYQRYAKASEVAKDMAQIEDPKFGSCFGYAVGQLIAEGFANAGTLGVTHATKAFTVQPGLGVRGGGTEVVLGVPGKAGKVAVHLMVAVLGRGDREVTLYLYSAVAPIPVEVANAAVASLSAQLSGQASGSRSA